MGKRGVWVATLVAFLLCISLAAGEHKATLRLEPLSQYEATSRQYDLHINNLGSEHVITEISAKIPGFEITGAIGYGGWLSTFSGDTIIWHDGTVETNVIDALFQFLLDAPVVNADQSFPVTITTKDSTGFTQQHLFTLTIQNDHTGPILSNIIPMDGSFVLEGTARQKIRVDAVDPETGMKAVNFLWRKCSDGNSNTLALQGRNNTYNDSINLTAFQNEDEICFSFEATNKGNGVTVYQGKFTIDGEAPIVSILSPADGALLNAKSLFRFIAADNLASILTCKLLVDGNVEALANASNGNITNVTTAELSEGTHRWYVECADMVGLLGKSVERRYILDKTPPAIAETPKDNSVIAAGTMIKFSITDNFVLEQVEVKIGNTTQNGTANTSINTTNMAEGKHQITVIAEDQAGNIAEKAFTYFIDKTPPNISLRNESNESDVHFTPQFIATDNFDATLDCSLLIDGTVQATGEAPSSILSSLTTLLAPGTYTYTISCRDDANNDASASERRIKIVDRSGPDITIEDIGKIIRGQSATIKATIIDFSDVEAVTGKVVDAGNAEHSIGFTFADDLYTSIFPTTPESPIGIYRAEITGTDENGFSSTASKTFEVVHNYFIGITVNPATATPGQQVQATGTVRRDDGTVPEETSIILKLPDGTEQQTSLDTATGSYSLTFQAPGHDGNYEVQAIFHANNGVAYTIKTTLVVATPASDSGSASSGGTRGLRGLGPSAGPGSSVGGTTSTSTSSTAPSSPAASSASQGEGAADGGAITGGPTGVAGTGSGAGKITGAAVSGVGRAASLFSLSALRTGRFWWTVFALVFLITVLIALGRRGQFHNEIEVEEEASKEQNGLSDWDNYLENLSKRR